MTGQDFTYSRDPAIDIAKGIAIFAVVASHTMRGTRTDGLIHSTLGFSIVDTALYLFHVQLFLVISGYLGYARANDARQQRDRQLTLAYPYLLWSTISLVALAAAHHRLPEPTVLASLASLLYAPIQHFWFLPVLMIGYLLLYRLRTSSEIAAALAVCITFRYATGFSYYALDYYLVFFLIGAWLRARPVEIQFSGATALLALFVFAAGTAIAVLCSIAPPTIPLLIPFSLAGCWLAWLAARALAGTTYLARWLAYAGRRSLPIYLVHVFFTAGTRAVLIKGDIREPILVLAIPFAAGLLLPLLIDELAARLRFDRLAGFTPFT